MRPRFSALSASRFWLGALALCAWAVSAAYAQVGITTNLDSVSLFSVNGSDPGSQDVLISAPAGTIVSVQAYVTGSGRWLTLRLGSTVLSGISAATFTFRATGNDTLTISAVPGVVPQGNYIAFIVLSAGSASTSVLVNYGVFPAGTITLSSPNLALRYPSAASANMVQVTNVNTAKPQPNVPVTARVDYKSGNGWLSVTPASGTTPFGITITPNLAGLDIATYQAYVTVDAGSVGSDVIAVTLVVQSPPVTLSVSPAGTLNFTYQLGGQAPPAQTLSLSASGQGATYQISSSQPWLKTSSSSGNLPASPSVSIDPSTLSNPGQLQGSLSISASGAVNSPLSVPVNLVVQSGAPAISEILSGVSFLSGIAPQSWVTLKGANLAPTTRTWRDDEVATGAFPTALDGVSVTINGKPAYVYYISPTQVNVLAPADTTAGPVPVQVTRGNVASNVAIANLQTYSPGFFLLGGTSRTAAVLADGRFAGPASLGPSYRPAKPGEMVVLFGTGFGPTTPQLPQGRAPQAGQLYFTASPVVVRVNDAPSTADFAGISGYAGVWQINVKLPAALPNGELPVVAEIEGVRSPAGFTITVQN